MFFLQRNWKYVILVGLVVCSIGAFVYLRNDVPQDPIILYKTTQPSKPRTNVENIIEPTAPNNNHGHSHEDRHSHNRNHRHDTVLHSNTEQESPSRNTYSPEENSVINTSLPETDTWEDLDVQQADTQLANSENSGGYMPANWHKIEDPELRAQYIRTQLIHQFGDIPEVHIIAEYERDRALGVPVTNDEITAYIEVLYRLWPNELQGISGTDH